MICLKGKAHEWRLTNPHHSDVVACRQCGEIGTLRDLDNDAGQFYAMRDERDKLQEELEAQDERRCESVGIGEIVNIRIRWESASIR